MCDVNSSSAITSHRLLILLRPPSVSDNYDENKLQTSTQYISNEEDGKKRKEQEQDDEEDEEVEKAC